MVMIRQPAYHFWKFLMKNMIPTNSGLIVCANRLGANGTLLGMFVHFLSNRSGQ